MPKLVNKNPKLGKNGNDAVVRYKGKTYRLGRHGTPESLTAYNRFCVELQTNPTFLVPKSERDITLDEVAAAYLEYANRRFGKTEYGHYRTALSFAVGIYGDQPVDAFSYQNLRTVRSEMIRSGRFCRDMINKYVGRIRTAFSWGVKHPELEKACREGKEVADYTVESALYKNALEGNVTAQIFWLKNRKPSQWNIPQPLPVVNVTQKTIDVGLEGLRQLLIPKPPPSDILDM